jgi:hypothetical protein
MFYKRRKGHTERENGWKEKEEKIWVKGKREKNK